MEQSLRSRHNISASRFGSVSGWLSHVLCGLKMLSTAAAKRAHGSCSGSIRSRKRNTFAFLPCRRRRGGGGLDGWRGRRELSFLSAARPLPPPLNRQRTTAAAATAIPAGQLLPPRGSLSCCYGTVTAVGGASVLFCQRKRWLALLGRPFLQQRQRYMLLMVPLFPTSLSSRYICETMFYPVMKTVLEKYQPEKPSSLCRHTKCPPSLLNLCFFSKPYVPLTSILSRFVCSSCGQEATATATAAAVTAGSSDTGARTGRKMSQSLLEVQSEQLAMKLQQEANKDDKDANNGISGGTHDGFDLEPPTAAAAAASAAAADAAQDFSPSQVR